MATPTYELLFTTTILVAAPLTITGIPSDYGDLVLAHDSGYNQMRVNNNTPTSTYSMVRITGNSSGATSFADNSSEIYHPDMAGKEGTTIVNFMDYSSTDKHKSILIRMSSHVIDVLTAMAARWPDTSAINEINLISNLRVGSVVSLYGVAK